MKASITQRLLASAKPAERVYDVADENLTGFLLRVYPNGKLAYYVRPARGVMKKIGEVPAFTPTQARTTAADVIRAYRNGEPHPILGTGDPPKQKAPTLRSYIDDTYTADYKLTHRNTKGLGNLNAFGSLLQTRLDQITREKVDDWRKARLRAGVTPATINRNLNALKACLSHAVPAYLPANPLTGLSRLTLPEENRVRYLDPDEEVRLRDQLAKARKRLRVMTLFAINTGLRRGELFTLEWRNITQAQIDGNLVEVVAVESGKSKSRRTRRIPLNREARALLDEWGRKKAGLVFPSSITGEIATDNRRAFYNALRKAKIEDFRWHDLRHHFASKLVMAGVPLNTVRELLGHSDIKLTLRYAHLAPGHLLEAVERIAG